MIRFILPILGEYCDAGYRGPKAKLKYALQSNGQFQFIMLGCGFVGAVYFLLHFGMQSMSLKATIVALAYAWGLILAIYLMGHGLVVIPRRLFYSANVARELRRLQISAPKLFDKLTGAGEELRELKGRAQQLQQKRAGLTSDLQEWIEELVRSSSMSEARNYEARLYQSSHGSLPTVITESYIAGLSRDLKRARHKHMRFDDEWTRLVQHANNLEVILNSKNTKTLIFERSSSNSFLKASILTPTLRYHLYANVLPYLRYCAGALLSLASICIVWSELIKSAFPNLSLIGLTVVHGAHLTIGGQFMAACWLLYMCTATLVSVTDIKVWGNRALVPRQTYPESAAWYSSQVAKLTIPLAFNFVTLLPFHDYSGIAFHHVLGHLINFTPLGARFSSFFPIFVLFPVVATLFGLYGKAQRFFSFGAFIDSDGDKNRPDWDVTNQREGQTLIERHNLNDRNNRLALANHESLPRAHDYTFSTNLARSDAIDPVTRPIDNQMNGSQETYRDEVTPTTTDGNFFSDFTHRIKNSIDTADKPTWWANLEDTFRRSDARNGSSADVESAESGLGSLFGGRIRL